MKSPPAGLGLAHTRPPELTCRENCHIDQRWEEWKPWALMEARRHEDVGTMIARFRTLHRNRVMALLGAGVRWLVIKRHKLDSPLLTPELFDAQLRNALERARTRSPEYKKIKKDNRKKEK